MIGVLTTLAAMPGRKAQLRLPAVLAVALALPLAGCDDTGGDATIPAENADAMITTLDQIQRDYENGQCDAAQPHVAYLKDQINGLPDTATEEVKADLRAAATNLETLIADDPNCLTPVEQTSEPDTTTSDETTTEEDEGGEDTSTPTDEEPPPGHDDGKPGKGPKSDSGGIGSDD
jgi:FIMAH domain-containing protein